MEDFVSSSAGEEANQSEPFIVVDDTDQIFSGFDVAARYAPGKVEQIWKVGLISGRGFSLVRRRHRLGAPSATGDCRVASVCARSKAPNGLLIGGYERNFGVAELFFCVAEFDPEIVVAIAQGRSDLE